ncbi:MAG TPA: hypothetical protein PJ990_21555 [Saprospiraceae bacterium]|nr:hypothetical protein [Saprospiraceae bacterium]
MQEPAPVAQNCAQDALKFPFPRLLYPVFGYPVLLSWFSDAPFLL